MCSRISHSICSSAFPRSTRPAPLAHWRHIEVAVVSLPVLPDKLSVAECERNRDVIVRPSIDGKTPTFLTPKTCNTNLFFPRLHLLSSCKMNPKRLRCQFIICRRLGRAVMQRRPLIAPFVLRIEHLNLFRSQLVLPMVLE
jgi:hypothetical protein